MVRDNNIRSVHIALSLDSRTQSVEMARMQKKKKEER